MLQPKITGPSETMSYIYLKSILEHIFLLSHHTKKNPWILIYLWISRWHMCVPEEGWGDSILCLFKHGLYLSVVIICLVFSYDLRYLIQFSSSFTERMHD